MGLCCPVFSGRSGVATAPVTPGQGSGLSAPGISSVHNQKLPRIKTRGLKRFADKMRAHKRCVKDYWLRLPWNRCGGMSCKANAVPAGKDSNRSSQSSGGRRDKPEIRHLHTEDGLSGASSPHALPEGQERGLRKLCKKKKGDYLHLKNLKLEQGGCSSVSFVVPGYWGPVKVCKSTSSSAPFPLREALEKEKRILGRLNHPNIVKKYIQKEQQGQAVVPGAGIKDTTKDSRALIMDAAGARIDGLLKTQASPAASPLPLPLLRGIMHQLGRALDYLHNTKQMVHCDIKPANILIKPCGQVTLCDFGFAVSLANQPALGHRAGTMNYMAPERIRQLASRHPPLTLGLYPCAIDSWSLGCCLYKMAFGDKAFRQDVAWPALLYSCSYGNDSHFLSQLDSSIDRNIEAVWHPEEGDVMQEQLGDLKTLLMGLLEYNPARRMTMHKVLEHPFLRDGPVVGEAAQKAQNEARSEDSVVCV